MLLHLKCPRLFSEAAAGHCDGGACWLPWPMRAWQMGVWQTTALHWLRPRITYTHGCEAQTVAVKLAAHLQQAGHFGSLQLTSGHFGSPFSQFGMGCRPSHWLVPSHSSCTQQLSQGCICSGSHLSTRKPFTPAAELLQLGVLGAQAAIARCHCPQGSSTG